MKKILVSLLVLAMMLAFTVPTFATATKDEGIVLPPPPKGDVNDDGAVTVEDALLVMRHAMGIEVIPMSWAYEAGDVNYDSTLDTTDALLILRYALGLITEF